jgi:hypothetical protein
VALLLISSLLAGLAASPAVAQALCPPGSTIVPSNSPFATRKCVRSGPQQAPAVRSRLPARSSLTPPVRRSVSANRPSKKVEQENPSAAPQRISHSCGAFNREVAAYHGGFADRFGDRAREQDQGIKRLKAAIKRQKTLARDFRRQAYRTKDLNLRRHYRQQEIEIRNDTEDKKAQLAELESQREINAEKWKNRYAQGMRELLGRRPANCTVELAQ